MNPCSISRHRRTDTLQTHSCATPTFRDKFYVRKYITLVGARGSGASQQMLDNMDTKEIKTLVFYWTAGGSRGQFKGPSLSPLVRGQLLEQQVKTRAEMSPRHRLQLASDLWFSLLYTRYTLKILQVVGTLEMSCLFSK